MVNRIRSMFTQREEGQGMIEYGLIIALVSVVAIAALVLLGPQVAAVFTQVTAQL